MATFKQPFKIKAEHIKKLSFLNTAKRFAGYAEEKAARLSMFGGHLGKVFALKSSDLYLKALEKTNKAQFVRKIKEKQQTNILKGPINKRFAFPSI